MPKMKIKVTIQKETYNRDAIVQENSISYLDEDKTRVNYNFDKNILIRENESFKMEYDFQNKKGKILLKDFNKILDIEIKVNKIEKKDHNIEIDYVIENDKFKYRIEELK